MCTYYSYYLNLVFKIRKDSIFSLQRLSKPFPICFVVEISFYVYFSFPDKIFHLSLLEAEPELPVTVYIWISLHHEHQLYFHCIHGTSMFCTHCFPLFQHSSDYESGLKQKAFCQAGLSTTGDSLQICSTGGCGRHGREAW